MLVPTLFLSVAATAAERGTVASPPSQIPLAAGPLQPPTGKVFERLPKASPSVLKSLRPDAASQGPAGVSKPSGVSPNETASPTPTPTATPDAFGSGNAPYTTALVKVQVQGFTAAGLNPVSSYPFRAAGKLYFSIGGASYICSAALIKPGVILTAAHCVYNYGTNSAAGWYSGWSFCPAQATQGAPYGCYAGVSARILGTYYNGSDVCVQTGVVCNDDMATIVMAPANGVLPGNRVGWFGYGWNGYSYNPFASLGNATLAQITQLGYPGAINSGLEMLRTDAVGYKVTSGNLINTQMGSAQTGGSSGGPWIVNFGTPPSFGAGSSPGSAASLAVVGVTSWGSTTVGYNVQGASFFGQNVQYNGTYGTYGAGNIGKLLNDTCTASPTAC